ncbi:hypothetical protein HKD37_03G007376 [Glycine soja]
MPAPAMMYRTSIEIEQDIKTLLLVLEALAPLDLSGWIVSVGGLDFDLASALCYYCYLASAYYTKRRTMATPPASPPPPPLDASASPSTLKRTRKATRLRSLVTIPLGAERHVVNVDPATGKADGPHKKKLRTYLGIVARDKVDVTYDTWKEVPTAQKDLIWEDIQAEFEIPEASDSRTKKKILQIVDERWRQFKSDLTRKWALAADKDGVDDIVCEKYDISKEKCTQFCQTRRDPSWEDVRKKAQASQKQNTAPTYCLVGVMNI